MHSVCKVYLTYRVPMKRGCPLSAASLAKSAKDPRQRTLQLGWTLNRAPEAIATDSPRHRPEEVSPEVVDVDAQSTISVSSTTAPLSCGLSDIGSSVRACRSTDSSGSDRLEAELVKVKAQLDRSNGVIATKVGVVLDAIIAKVIDAPALGK